LFDDLGGSRRELASEAVIWDRAVFRQHLVKRPLVSDPLVSKLINGTRGSIVHQALPSTRVAIAGQERLETRRRIRASLSAVPLGED
jgi:hypothetical protein